MSDLSVLLVDDDAGDRMLLKRLLACTEYRTNVQEAKSCSEALECSSTDLDAVFLDQLLPEVTGLDSIAMFREKWPRAAIFLMTGHGDETLAKTSIQMGATDYVPKTAINRNALQRMLRNGVEATRTQWKLEQQRLDLATFAEVLIHDFRAPIRAADFLAEQILEDFEDGHMDGVREGAAMMRKSTKQMLLMIKSLAEHIRLDRDVEYDHVSPADMIEGALLNLDLVISETATRIEVELDPDLEPIPCSSPQIVQLLQNLIANAIKYAGQKRPEITVRVSERGTETIFAVADNGVGIPFEYRETIFLPFKRLPGTAEINGTGLGLATCRKIVMRHGGRIWCEPNGDRGTRMIFSLPRRAPLR